MIALNIIMLCLTLIPVIKGLNENTIKLEHIDIERNIIGARHVHLLVKDGNMSFPSISEV